ncbi:hypothetical protein [uncultured Paludibaculum sp.]|uniref:hypothetical protein n=1 Tax=uncultured Paludibaculum sp. TaxID=1765020 RepID=UPI002AAC11C3|nr:hypothetical protein [uncultured Paludibaculum sp.]
MAENHHSDPEPPLPRAASADLSRWAAAVLLIAVIVGFYWKLIFTNQFTWLYGPDTASQVLPWFQFEAGEWHRGHIPLWDPNTFGGQPLLAQAQPGVAYPLNWLLFALPLGHGWLRQIYLHWYFVVIHLMAAWFAYKLCRELACRRTASVFGAAVFSLSGWMGVTEWPQMINGAVWAPLVYLYLIRTMRGRNPWLNSVLAGFFLGVAWLSGHHQIPIFLSLSCAGAWLWFLASHLRADPRRWTAALLLFWLLAVSTAAVQILPAQEYGKLSVRWVDAPDAVTWDQKVPYTVHLKYGLNPVSVLGILVSGWSLNSDPFVGVAAFTLGLIGIALVWKRWETRLFAAIAVGGLLYSLANFNVLHGILYSLLPVVDKARNSSMAVFLFGFGVSILAALGLDALDEARESDWVRRASTAVLYLGAFIFATRFVLLELQPLPGAGGEQRSLMTGLAALLLAVWLQGVRRNQIAWRAAALCALLLFLVEVTGQNSFYLPHVYEKERLEMLNSMRDHGDIARFLRQQPGLPRVEIDDAQIKYNFGDWYGIPQSGGYLASLTKNVQAMGFNEPAVKRLMGVAYAVGKAPTAFHKDEVFSGTSGLKIFRNGDVMPRVFAVHEVTRLNDRLRGMEELNRIAPDMARKAFVFGQAPQLAQCGGTDDVWIPAYASTRIQVTASLSCRGLVILADTYFPGWKATVDGKDVPVYEVDGLVRGVVCEAGKHEIEYVYRPASILLGGFASFASLLAAGVCFVMVKRRR